MTRTGGVFKVGYQWMAKGEEDAAMTPLIPPQQRGIIITAGGGNDFAVFPQLAGRPTVSQEGFHFPPDLIR
jgi:hypothetical protein